MTQREWTRQRIDDEFCAPFAGAQWWRMFPDEGEPIDVVRRDDAIRIANAVRLDMQVRIAELEAMVPQMPQPDWATAPEWAQWHCIDAHGAMSWFELEPVLGFGNWTRPLGALWGLVDIYDSDTLPLGVDWRTTLQQRPEVTK